LGHGQVTRDKTTARWAAGPSPNRQHAGSRPTEGPQKGVDVRSVVRQRGEGLGGAVQSWSPPRRNHRNPNHRDHPEEERGGHVTGGGGGMGTGRARAKRPVWLDSRKMRICRVGGAGQRRMAREGGKFIGKPPAWGWKGVSMQSHGEESAQQPPPRLPSCPGPEAGGGAPASETQEGADGPRHRRRCHSGGGVGRCIYGDAWGYEQGAGLVAC